MQKYLIVPMPAGPFVGLDLVARAVFGLIWDRYKLSMYTVTGCAGDSVWYDHDRGAVYCVYPQKDIADGLGVSVRTVQRALDVLTSAKILSVRKADYKSACRYYVASRVCDYMRPTPKHTEKPTQ